MKKIIASLIASAAILASTASATPFIEQADAGYTTATAQAVGNNTTQIFGALSSRDSVDMFKFKWNGGQFAVNTFGTNFDTMLFLFDKAGTKLAFNDDYLGLQSYIGIGSLNSGDYMLAINQFSFNYNGNLNGFNGAGEVRGPNAAYFINFNAAVNSTEVPEPAPLALLGLGALGLALARRKQA